MKSKSISKWKNKDCDQDSEDSEWDKSNRKSLSSEKGINKKFFYRLLNTFFFFFFLVCVCIFLLNLVFEMVGHKNRGLKRKESISSLTDNLENNNENTRDKKKKCDYDVDNKDKNKEEKKNKIRITKRSYKPRSKKMHNIEDIITETTGDKVIRTRARTIKIKEIKKPEKETEFPYKPPRVGIEYQAVIPDLISTTLHHNPHQQTNQPTLKVEIKYKGIISNVPLGGLLVNIEKDEKTGKYIHTDQIKKEKKE